MTQFILTWLITFSKETKPFKWIIPSIELSPCTPRGFRPSAHSAGQRLLHLSGLEKWNPIFLQLPSFHPTVNYFDYVTQTFATTLCYLNPMYFFPTMNTDGYIKNTERVLLKQIQFFHRIWCPLKMISWNMY